ASTTHISTVRGSTTATSCMILSSIIPRWSPASFPVPSAASTISSVSCVTAIGSILPRRPDVTDDDVVDQAFYGCQVIGKDNPVWTPTPEVPQREGIADDRLQLGIRLGLRTGTEQFQ